MGGSGGGGDASVRLSRTQSGGAKLRGCASAPLSSGACQRRLPAGRCHSAVTRSYISQHSRTPPPPAAANTRPRQARSLPARLRRCSQDNVPPEMHPGAKLADRCGGESDARAGAAALMHPLSAEKATLIPKHVSFNVSCVSDSRSGGVIKIYDSPRGGFHQQWSKNLQSKRICISAADAGFYLKQILADL